MKSLNLAITLCIYFARLEGLLTLPSSQPNQEGKVGEKAWNGLEGLGGSGLSGLGGNFLGSGGSGSGGSGLGALGGMLGGSSVDNSGGGGCSKYKIISARGTGENQVSPTGCRGFINGVLSAVPGGAVYEVHYPATVDYMTGPGQGASDAIRYISDQQKKCPEQLYVLIGYSEGAMVVTQTMNKISDSSSSIAAIVLYGNPYFKGGAPQNACSAKGGAGDASATGIRMPDKFSSVTFDCCLTGDMICQTTGSIVAHLEYPGSASEKEAVRFASSKLKNALDGNHSSKPGYNADGDKGSSGSEGTTSSQGTTGGGNGLLSGFGSGSTIGGLPSLGSGISGLPSIGSGTGDSTGISSLLGGGSGGMGGIPSFGGGSGMGGIPSFGGSSSGTGGIPSLGGGIPGLASMGSGRMSAKSKDTA
ncbi:family 5 carbohydrate esterase [Melampsora larici-populina 98AG31]|uniref:Family 5 carbohydrate esterase n=1 Tax=Melampsora larici-populina (strain 98AG31 / pathotype 3-4-7) TaxID=747676 RepID=F4RL65_MELLP|nr:family 5 carbohydrate esterase [Melampsora larici-populina 98AG31]EGG06919.1 family 5 carbohydrate esterase [Melampsora larici-populina 98AG31]